LVKEPQAATFESRRVSTRTAGQSRIASYLLFATTALAPLPFGSSEPAVVAFWCIVLGLCLSFSPVYVYGVGQLALVGLAGVVVAAYALVVHEQLAEHPWLPVARPHPIWSEASEILGLPVTPSVSIVRYQPWFELGRPLACMLALACGFLVGTESRRARQLLKVIAWSGLGYAIYGILAYTFDPTRILWREKDAYLLSVTGTFINRNTAAAFFGSCAIVWSVLLWDRIRREMPRGPLDWRAVPARLAASTPSGLVIVCGMLFVCLAAMFMTGSRGGVLLSLFALSVAFAAFFFRDLPYWNRIVTALAGSTAATLLLLQIMGAGVNLRFDMQGAADEGRLETYRATLRMIADHPWLGTGLGTFADAFPSYRSSSVSMWGVWDVAHNTLLEIASEMGLPVAALVVVAWTVIFVVLARGVLTRRRDAVVPVAALAVAILAVLHSLIDFTLQIPGYSIVALALIGAGLAQSFRSERHPSPQRIRHGRAGSSRSEVNVRRMKPEGLIAHGAARWDISVQ
jgi:O-antigen ligase